MDWWSARHILQGLLALAAMVLAGAGMILAWRLRGILRWRRSLNHELKCLARTAEGATEARHNAVKVVVERCHRMWRQHFPEFEQLTDLSGYIRSVAACYHPNAERPELRLATGRFLKAARESVNRLELILHRPGFQKLRRVRIRHLRQSFEWYKRYPLVKWFGRHRKVISRISQLRLLILPDPFSWLFYLSNRLTMLTLTRYLLMDVYLFVGTLAVHAYDEEEEGYALATEMDELEQTLEDLEDLESLESPQPPVTDPRVREIRNGLVGFTGSLTSTPGLEEWKDAVREAAEVTAGKYFPGVDRPLEEAALGPLLERCGFWIRSVCDTENLPVVRRLHNIRLETLYNLKSLPGTLPLTNIPALAKKSWNMYRLAKWPLKIYRWVKKTAPAGITVEVGWLVAKKAFISYIYGYTFDVACRELEMVYKYSRDERDETSSVGNA